MDWVTASVINGFLVLCGVGLWFIRPRLSKQEKVFVSFVQNEAKESGVKIEEIGSFVFKNWDNLMNRYMAKNDCLMLSNVPCVLRTIRETYQRP